MTELKKTDTPAEIDRLEVLYRAGDYRQAREMVRRTASLEGLSDEERLRIEKVARAMSTDKGALIAFAFTFLVLAFLVIKYGI